MKLQADFILDAQGRIPDSSIPKNGLLITSPRLIVTCYPFFTFDTIYLRHGCPPMWILPTVRRVLQADVIQESIGGLPQDQMHCAQLSVETLHATLEDYMAKQRNLEKERIYQINPKL
jgi:hypothetical protein